MIHLASAKSTTGLGFALSAPYFATGTVYAGNETFVDCAENQRRFGVCSQLKICVFTGSSDARMIQKQFPPSFVRNINDIPYEDVRGFLDSGDCNVIAADDYVVLTSSIYDGAASGMYVYGSSYLNYAYNSIVSRSSDPQWADILQGTVEAVRLWSDTPKQDSSCPMDSENSLGINFFNAPACVGNFLEMTKINVPPDAVDRVPFLQTLSKTQPSGIGKISAPQFGTLECSSCANSLDTSTLAKIRRRGQLNCGVIDDAEDAAMPLMGEEYCRAIAAAIFLGDSSAVSITRASSYDAILSNFSSGDIDVVAGESRFALGGFWTPDLSGWDTELSGSFSFSVPYYCKCLEK